MKLSRAQIFFFFFTFLLYLISLCAFIQFILTGVRSDDAWKKILCCKLLKNLDVPQLPKHLSLSYQTFFCKKPNHCSLQFVEFKPVFIGQRVNSWLLSHPVVPAALSLFFSFLSSLFPFSLSSDPSEPSLSWWPKHCTPARKWHHTIVLTNVSDNKCIKSNAINEWTHQLDWFLDLTWKADFFFVGSSSSFFSVASSSSSSSSLSKRWYPQLFSTS